MSAIINLPFPPSINALWRATGRRVYRTKKYTGWIAQALAEIAVQCPQPVPGRYVIRISLGRPDKRRRDVDNYGKAISDVLKEAGVIEDDSFAQMKTIRWSDKINGCQVRIRSLR